MDRDIMEFGPRGNPARIPHPLTGADITRRSFQVSSTGINGATDVRHSNTSSASYNWSWNAKSRTLLQPVLDCYSGIRGPGPFYFVDAAIADLNVLPPWFAAPMMAALDGPILDGREQKPSTAATAANTLDYPVRTPTFPLTGAASLSVYVPIPVGGKFWFGAHGTATGTAKVRLRGWRRDNGLADSMDVTLLSVTSTTRVNASFGSNVYYGIDIDFTGTGNLSIAGMIAQVLDMSATPKTGGFIAGMGNSGVDFDEIPQPTVISGALDQINMTARLVEVGGWA